MNARSPAPARAANRCTLAASGLALVCVTLLVPRAADAHAFGLSLIEIDIGDRSVQVKMTCDLEHLELAGGLDTNDDRHVSADELEAGRDALGSYLIDRFRVRGAGAPCEGALHELVYDAPRTAGIITIEYVCGQPLGTVELNSQVFNEQPGRHAFMGVVVEEDRRFRVRFDRKTQRVVYEATPPAATEVIAQHDDELQPASMWATFEAFGRLGVEHIATGFDHILFVLSLLAVARRLRDVVVLVTSFTVAHSITLALAALHLLALPTGLVEPLIAASIFVVATENVIREQVRYTPEAMGRVRAESRWRAGVVFAFGLIHGFGFASVLADIGMPNEQLLTALLAFNLGVEAGQLAIVVPVWATLHMAMRGAWHGRAIQLASVVIAGISAWWFLQRVA